MSAYEQYISHLRMWTSKYHLAFAEIESMPLDVLFELEVVDSKIEAEFEKKRRVTGSRDKHDNKVFIDQIF